jgi:hypothetical protein
MQSTSTCINIEYTTIAKLILRDSKKVNGGQTVATRCKWANLFHEASTRYVETLPRLETSAPRLNEDHAANGRQLGAEAIAQRFRQGRRPSFYY